MSIIFALIIASMFAIRYSVKIERTIAPAMLLQMIILYISGIIFDFRIGVSLCLLLVAVCVVYLFVSLVKSKRRVWAVLITPGSVSFIILIAYYLVVSLGYNLQYESEFYNHGLIVKYLYNYMDFPQMVGNGVLFSNSPSMVSVWCMFMTIFWLGYSEGMMLIGVMSLYVALLLPLFDNVHGFKDWKKAMLICFFIVTIPHAIAYGEMASAISICPDVIYGLIVGNLLISCLKYCENKSLMKKTEIILMIVWLLLPVLYYVFDGGASAFKYNDVINDNLGSIWASFISINVFYVGYVIKIQAVMVLVILMVVILMFAGFQKVSQNAQMIGLMPKVAIGLIFAYFLAEFIAATTKPAIESLQKYNQGRIATIIICAILMMVLYVGLGYKNGYWGYVITFCFLLTFSNVVAIFPIVESDNDENIFYAIEDYDFEVGDKVYLVDTDILNSNCQAKFYYEVMPATANYGDVSYTWYPDDNAELVRYSADEVITFLAEGGYNYVYLKNVDESFYDSYSELFGGEDKIEVNHLYKVVYEGDKIELILQN